MSARVFGAVDIGASGGRVMAGVLEGGQIRLETVHRFPNGVTRRDGHLRWDVTGLFQQVLTGLALLADRHPQVESIGIDTWAVDYGLLDEQGTLLGEPISYRDGRTADAVHRVDLTVAPRTQFDVNGLQRLPFTTLFQLEAEKSSPLWERARTVVLLPDLLSFWLTGQLAAERTNASTTGLVDVRTGRWSTGLMSQLGLPPERFPRLDDPGTIRGRVLPEIVSATGLPQACVVTAVGSHDTASAVVGVPAASMSFAYVSSGTWSLAGLELRAPVLSSAAFEANFTNEGGVDRTVRFLRNVGGLWLLQESLRDWQASGVPVGAQDVLAAAEALPAGGPRIDVDDPGLIAPGDMPRRINDAVSAMGEAALESPPAVVRCILDSLAAAYAETTSQAARLADRDVDVIHIVGGGSRNKLLCQLTADLSGVRVVAGPVEATAIGNLLVQARTHGAAPSSLPEMRAMLAGSVRDELREYAPGGG